MDARSIAPGGRMSVSMEKMTAPRDAISIRGVPRDRRVRAFFDGSEVAVEDFSSVARYPEYYERFVRVRDGARVFEVVYEGEAVATVVIQAFDLTCNAEKPPCGL